MQQKLIKAVAAEMCEAATPVTPSTEGAGIYLLYERGVLRYVGQSRDVQRRLRYHHIEFDRAKFIPEDDLRVRKACETILIVYLRPKRNRTRKWWGPYTYSIMSRMYYRALELKITPARLAPRPSRDR